MARDTERAAATAEDEPAQLKGGEATAEQDKHRPQTPAATGIVRFLVFCFTVQSQPGFFVAAIHRESPRAFPIRH